MASYTWENIKPKKHYLRLSEYTDGHIEVAEFKVMTFSPSGKYIKLQTIGGDNDGYIHWEAASRVRFVEEL